MEQNEPNRQRIHLAEPKRCLDEASHLFSSQERRASYPRKKG